MHVWERGNPKEKDLPVIKKASKGKIPRTLVDPDWLGVHPENDMPLCIQEVEFEGDPFGGGEGEVEDEDDLYGDPPEDETAPWGGFNESQGM